MIKSKNEIKLGILGLGYVGLPLAIEFSKKRKVIGFDVDKKRIDELKSGLDKNLEFDKKAIDASKNLYFSNDEEDLKSLNCFVITVPTPIDEFKKPDLNLLVKASEMAGNLLKKGNLIIYESTVYPGCLEEICIPILEKKSKLKFNQDFFCGYSPERINPGDKEHTISKIRKITSGSTPFISDLVDELYNEIIKAGTHRAPTIKVAEAAKVIENTQRDLNIALINELSIIFDKMNIDTKAVLDAAGSKWNFLPFVPGLVGGHCIGVDPYYLTYKAEKIGYRPKIILAGRELNDNMGIYVATELIKKMKKKNIKIKEARILIMGLTFKENCPDTRNSGVQNVINELRKYECKLDLHDPWADRDEIKKITGIYPIIETSTNTYDAILITVAHDQFKSIGYENLKNFCKKNHVIYDFKNILSD